MVLLALQNGKALGQFRLFFEFLYLTGFCLAFLFLRPSCLDQLSIHAGFLVLQQSAQHSVDVKMSESLVHCVSRNLVH